MYSVDIPEDELEALLDFLSNPIVSRRLKGKAADGAEKLESAFFLPKARRSASERMAMPVTPAAPAAVRFF